MSLTSKQMQDMRGFAIEMRTRAKIDEEYEIANAVLHLLEEIEDMQISERQVVSLESIAESLGVIAESTGRK